jgi:hypothetical protein
VMFRIKVTLRLIVKLVILIPQVGKISGK